METDTPQTGTQQRVAIVTGGSGGIGRAVAERLAADGTAVVVHYAGNAGRAQETVDAITAAGGTAVALGGDVADEDAMGALFDEAQRRFGGGGGGVQTPRGKGGAPPPPPGGADNDS